jgi:putative transposase
LRFIEGRDLPSPLRQDKLPAMSDYRRYFVPGGTYFFTVVTARRAPYLCSAMARSLLRATVRECLARWPFQIDAIVLLPDHFHTIWTLPKSDTSYSRRLGWIKKEFTKAWLADGGAEISPTASRSARGGHGVWQRRFWEHTVRDEDDFSRLLD